MDLAQLRTGLTPGLTVDWNLESTVRILDEFELSCTTT